jgi:hypothetical protein
LHSHIAGRAFWIVDWASNSLAAFEQSGNQRIAIRQFQFLAEQLQMLAQDFVSLQRSKRLIIFADTFTSNVAPDAVDYFLCFQFNWRPKPSSSSGIFSDSAA